MREHEETAAAVWPLGARDQLILWTALGSIAILSWIYLLWMPMTPGDLGGLAVRVAGLMPANWASLWLVFMMWTVMMAAMMTPSASPMIMTYARIVRGRERGGWPRVWLFAAGYLVMWTLFSAVATAGQVLLQRAALLTNAVSIGPVAGGVILAAAGIYQFTPLKTACLSYCQSPIGFFMTNWREGAAGALWMGLKHGAFCIGCCWMLMALLFVAGAMNLLWIAALSAFVLIEKAVPRGELIAKAAGVAMIAGGVALVAWR
jgi:predicted metal-binding membrane protein